jgi:hypothetical protein
MTCRLERYDELSVRTLFCSGARAYHILDSCVLTFPAQV